MSKVYLSVKSWSRKRFIVVFHLTAIIRSSMIRRRAIMTVIVWSLDLQLPMQSVSITTKVVSSNPAYGEVYSTQHYVIKFVSDLQQVGDFLHQ